MRDLSWRGGGLKRYFEGCFKCEDDDLIWGGGNQVFSGGERPDLMKRRALKGGSIKKIVLSSINLM